MSISAKEEGITSMSFDTLAKNDLDRFDLAADVVDCVPRLGPKAAYAKQAIRDKRIEHQPYIAEHGEDPPEVRDWKWQSIRQEKRRQHPCGSERMGRPRLRRIGIAPGGSSARAAPIETHLRGAD